MKKSFKYLALIFALHFVFACSNNNSKPVVIDNPDPRIDQYMVRTAEDTLNLINMTKQYLDLLKNNDYDKALDLLFEVKGKQVQPISQKRRNNLLESNRTFPVLSYDIDELLLYSDSDTEVRYTIQFIEKVEGVEGPTTLKCSVHPKRIKGAWYLTIEDEKRER